jgi:hypothetical protein
MIHTTKGDARTSWFQLDAGRHLLSLGQTDVERVAHSPTLVTVVVAVVQVRRAIDHGQFTLVAHRTATLLVLASVGSAKPLPALRGVRGSR